MDANLIIISVIILAALAFAVGIIIKKIEGGQPYFWSVIPFWKTQKDEFCLKIKKVLLT